MAKKLLLGCLLFLSFLTRAQITLMGHAMINNSPLSQVAIEIKEGHQTLKTLQTQGRSDFKVVLEFGKIYHVYFRHPKSPSMCLEVRGDNIPAEKRAYLMTYELIVPFVYEVDEDVDTSVFVNPFHRVVFDGNRLMVEDTSYNNAFAKTIIKSHNHPVGSGNGEIKQNPGTGQILAGQIYFNEDPKAQAKDNSVQLIAKNGSVIMTSHTNHFGGFCFPGITTDDVGKIRLAAQCAGTCTIGSLYSTSGQFVGNAARNGDICEWVLSQKEITQLNDSYFTYNIGGKLVSSSAKEKKFFAKKDVYLCNKYNTVIQKVKTNLIGAFVFQDIKPDRTYYLCVSKSDLAGGEKIDLLNKEDILITRFDTTVAGRSAIKLHSSDNKRFSDLSVDNDEIKMDVKATIFGDNVNNPIGKLKILLLNDDYEVIDSAITDNFGTFKFKYLPFLKRFYLSAENTDNMLDVFKNILIYSSDDNLIKIMTHQKGNKFSYSPLHAEITSLRDIELEDPWLELIDEKKTVVPDKRAILLPGKSIVENILFENNKAEISPQSREVLDKIILVLNTNKLLKIEVGAHTDSKGDAEANLRLSEARAKTVKEYMVKNGIESGRVVAKGYGETKLLNNCKDHTPCNEAEHAQNRRIEFKVLGE